MRFSRIPSSPAHCLLILVPLAQILSLFCEFAFYALSLFFIPFLNIKILEVVRKTSQLVFVVHGIKVESIFVFYLVFRSEIFRNRN
jgi:hypothetical protein